jgi:hypothetical protein
LRDESLRPPHGFDQPVRGFGLLWRTTEEVRDRLGWASDSEVGARTAVQRMFADDGEVAFLKNLYSGVYRLDPDGTWTFLEEQAAPAPTAPSGLLPPS